MKIEFGKSQIYLECENESLLLSEHLDGDHIFPAYAADKAAFIYWVNYGVGQTRIVAYNLERRAYQYVNLSGFSFVSSLYLCPLMEEESLRAFIFLGTKNKQDDIYLFNFADSSLSNLTRSEASESNIVFHQTEQKIIIEFETKNNLLELTLDKKTFQPGEIKKRLKAEVMISVVQKNIQDDIPQAVTFANSLTAFGDSITAGKMRMNDLIGEMHPELAYPEVVKEKLILVNYGTMTVYNRGVGGDSTLDGKNRIAGDLVNYPAYFFAVMLGTNDTYLNQFSLQNSKENMEFIINRILQAGSYPLLMTIPPRNDFYGTLDYVKKNIADFNNALKEIAQAKEIVLLDVHKAFVDYNPPNGWKTLLEDIGGNHPSPEGHQVIADLIAPALIAAPPIAPAGIKIVRIAGNAYQISWSKNYEYDFSHYEFEYGWNSADLKFKQRVSNNLHTIYVLPFTRFYFRLCAVDQQGNKSSYSSTFSTKSN